MRLPEHLSLLKVTVTSVVYLAALAVTTGCSTPYDPLQDFEPVAPATQLEPPQLSASRDTAYPLETVQRGKYLVKLLGCGLCHTDGALVGKPDRALNLAGSQIGIAVSNPLAEKYPAVVYPPNITPDPDTGIGNWSESELVGALREGEGGHRSKLLAVMPWPTYALITDADASAISAYLFSLPPVIHQVPDNVSTGSKASSAYVHFGVYRSRQLGNKYR